MKRNIMWLVLLAACDRERGPDVEGNIIDGGDVEDTGDAIDVVEPGDTGDGNGGDDTGNGGDTGNGDTGGPNEVPEDCVPTDEICDGLDNDCDGWVDNNPIDGTTYWLDEDGDGYGDPDSARSFCWHPSNRVTNDDDCDDEVATAFPGAEEICDGVQSDCDSTTWTTDAGMVTFTSTATGAHEDWSTAFSAGTALAPADILVDEAGALRICEGTWHVSLELTDSVDVSGHGGRDLVVLSGADLATIAWVRTDAVSASFTGLTFQDGDAEFEDAGNDKELGGAIHCAAASDISVDDCVFSGNTSPRWGGAIGVDGCDLTVTDASFDDNHGHNGGGAVMVMAADATVSMSDFTGNSCDIEHDHEGGGALLAGGDALLTVSDSTFSLNACDNGGAAALMATAGLGEPSATFTDATFSENVGADAAAILVDEGTLTLTDCAVSDHADSAIDVKDATADFTGTTFTANGGDDKGGALEFEHATVTIDDCTFTDNVADKEGAAIYGKSGDSVLTVTSSAFTDNDAGEKGGALYFKEGTLSISDTSFDDHDVAKQGGAVFVKDADVTIDDCTFDNNTSGEQGGAFAWQDSEGTITSSGFTNNTAEDLGGGLWLKNPVLDITTCTFSGNSPDDVGLDHDDTSYTYTGSTTVTCDSNDCD